MPTIHSSPPTSPRAALRSLWVLALILTFAVAAGCSDDVSNNPGDPDTGEYRPDITQDTSIPPSDIHTDPDAGGYKLDIPRTMRDTTGGGDDTSEGGPDVITLDGNMGGEDTEQTTPIPVVVDSIFPTSGPSAGQNTILMIGSGFTPDSEVYFGSQRAPEVIYNDDDEIEIVVPSNDAGLVNVKVINANGAGTLEDAYTYVDPIEIEAITPERSPTRGGMPFAIEGSGFDGEVFVTIGDRAAVEVQLISASRLTGITPPNPEGTADVRVTSEAGSTLKQDAIVYYASTEIADVHPGAGSTTGNDPATITGVGFEGSVRVTIDGAEATIVSTSKNSIDILTPPGSVGAADVTVSSDNGTYTLEGGYLYLNDPADANFDVVDVRPDSGSAAGGEVAVLRGTALDTATQVTFGGAAGTILDATANSIRVQVPAGTGGAVVDVTVDIAGPPTNSETLTGAYTYHATLGGVSPSTGDAAGGETVTISGEGFASGVQVFFGPIEATVTNVTPTSITVTTPPGAGGSVNVTISQMGYEETLEDAYFYSTPLDVFALSPRRSSQAGGTLVTVVGKGFSPSAGITVDSVAVDAADVTYVNSSTLRFIAPPHPAGIVDVEITQDAEVIPSPDLFTYYDPSSQFGGGWGSAVLGNLNITVLDSETNLPIENAYVIVSADVSTSLQGLTDTLGQITFSDTDLEGVQSVTGVADGYASSTITSINAENITLFLIPPQEPPSGNGNPPTPPEPSYIFGTITGVNKVSLSDDPNLVRRALVITTETLDPNDPNPDPGPGGVVENDDLLDGVGDYRINARLGTVAVLGLCGIYNIASDTFSPKFIAMQRFVQVPPGSEIEVHLDCATPMNQQSTIKLVNAPVGQGTDLNVIFPILEIGPEGYLVEWIAGDQGASWTKYGSESLFNIRNFVPITGPFAEARYSLQAISFATAGPWAANGYPQSVAIVDDITEFNGPIEMGPMMGIPQMITPREGDVMLDTRVEWTIGNPDTIDLFEALMFESDGQTVAWDAYMPGDATGFDLPDLSGVPNAPGQYTGPVFMFLSAVKMKQPGFDFNNFTLLDTSLYGHGPHLSWSDMLMSFTRP